MELPRLQELFLPSAFRVAVLPYVLGPASCLALLVNTYCPAAPPRRVCLSQVLREAAHSRQSMDLEEGSDPGTFLTRDVTLGKSYNSLNLLPHLESGDYNRYTGSTCQVQSLAQKKWINGRYCLLPS